MHKLITVVLLLAGCATTEQPPATMIDMDMLYDQITVTHRLLVPGTDVYCEVGDSGFDWDTCVPSGSYAESEE